MRIKGQFTATRIENDRGGTQLISELIHEFTDVVTAVIGYNELTLDEIEHFTSSPEWREKIKSHTTQLWFES